MTETPLNIEDQEIYPESMLDRVRLIGQIRKSPELLYGMFLELTRQMYSEAANLTFGTDYKLWKPDVKETGIWIDTDYEWEDKDPEFRPAIYVKLGEIRYKSAAGWKHSQISMDLEEGVYNYARYGEGVVSWIHIGQSKGETVSLCSATLDYIDALSRVIRDDFCFETFEVTSASPLTLDKESRERYRSMITAAFTFQDAWSIKLESPKLKRLVFNAGRNLFGYDIFLS